MICGLIVLCVAVPTFAQSSLSGRREFTVGDSPVALIAVDFDADGILDLVAANRATSTTSDLHLLKGFGDGTFRRIATVVAGSQPSGVVLADANNDGNPDLIASNRLSRDVTVNLGDGLGGFGARIVSGVSGNPAGLAVGDWNGDGRVDVATVNLTNVSILLGDGTGRFTFLRQFTPGLDPKQVLAADFNADGRPDLAVVNNSSNSVQIWRGAGTGEFTLTNTLTTGLAPLSAAVGLFDANTRPDIAVSNNAADTVSVFLANTTGGGFGSPTTLSPGFGPRALLVGDLNKDGRADLVVTMSKVSQVGEIAVLNGNGSGGFAAPVVFKTGPVPNSGAIGDFNRDTNLDVATANLTGNSVSVLLNAGTGSFVTAARVNLPFGAFPHGVAVADFNRDGKPDVASANQATNNVTVAAGDGLCGFAAVTSANNTGITPFAIAAHDFNRDGNVDMVTANNGDDGYSYLQNNGASNFTVTTRPAGCSGPVALSAGEMTGDVAGLLDLALVCENDHPGDLCVQIGTGDAGSAAFGAPVCTYQLIDVPGGIATGNYNLDDLEDLAITSTIQNKIMTGISEGTGHLREIPAATFPTGAGPKGIVHADFNGDNFLDLLVANSGGSTLSALLGDGGGLFTPGLETPVGQAPTSLAVADYNSDGRPDVAVVNTNSNSISLMLGDGQGNFTHAGNYGTRDAPIAVAAGDCNLDGKPDILVADNFNDSITVLVNQTPAGDPLQTVTVSGHPRTYLRWGLVPGGAYDLIRGLLRSVVQTPSTYNLGSVTCLLNDVLETDSAAAQDSTIPPVGDGYFYLVRSTAGGASAPWTVSSSGKPGVPASGSCP